MTTVEIKGVGTVDFPDSMSQEEIVDAIKTKIIPQTQQQQTTAPAPEQEEQEQGTFTDIAEGVGAGLIGVPQGIAELGAAGIDLVADTDTSRTVTKTFEDFKEYLGLDPQTGAGKAAEGITNFASAFIPVVGFLGRAGQVARAAKAGTDVERSLKATTALGRKA